MKVKIIRLYDNQAIDAHIILPHNTMLPSLSDGWRFNFKKHSKRSDFQTYILVCDKTLKTIEGCLTFQMRGLIEPYMAYIEIAPHNKGKNRQYENIAGCLIAFACRLSFIHGEGGYKGWLAFDVLEKEKEDEIKLMAIYCAKYGALKYGNTSYFTRKRRIFN
jgi:hypothetical protein